jgi:putative phosphotransacetylase
MSNPIEEKVVDIIAQRLKRSKVGIPVGVSNRHLHLREEDFKTLFGPSAKLTVYKWLKQPGFFAANETVTIKGPKGSISNVRILGPFRKHTQLEVSPADARRLGLNPPVRESGGVKNSPGIEIATDTNAIKIPEGVIISQRHIHMNSEDAKKLDVKNGDVVSVRVQGSRAVVFEEVVCRVSNDYKLEFHIDVDEANCVMVSGDELSYML